MKSVPMMVGIAALSALSLYTFANEGKSGGYSSLDADRNGKVSKDEAKGMSDLSSQFKSLDANSDGDLDQAELSKFEAMEGDAMETKRMDAPGSDTGGTIPESGGAMPGGHDAGDAEAGEPPRDRAVE
jgi:hypothetical protein